MINRHLGNCFVTFTIISFSNLQFSVQSLTPLPVYMTKLDLLKIVKAFLHTKQCDSEPISGLSTNKNNKKLDKVSLQSADILLHQPVTSASSLTATMVPFLLSTAPSHADTWATCEACFVIGTKMAGFCDVDNEGK